MMENQPAGTLADPGTGAGLMPLRSIHIVFASTSGHTEYVVDTLIDSLRGIARGWEIGAARAEKTSPEDLLKADVLLLASGTWDVRGVEGELNPHMRVLLHDKATDLDLAGRRCACIALGDDRYFYTAGAADHLERYVQTHQGRSLLPTLRIINEPYGQEAIVGTWARKLVGATNQLAGR